MVAEKSGAKPEKGGPKPEPPQCDERKVGSLYAKTDLLKAISEYLNDALPELGYVEDHFWTNLRILLSIVCCGFGCYAQFGTKFPQDRLIIGGCVVGYFVVSGILALIDYFVVKTSVINFKVGDKSVFLDINMPAFSPEVTLVIRSGEQQVSHKTSVAQYFDYEGVLVQENLFEDVINLLRQFESLKEGVAPGKKDKHQ